MKWKKQVASLCLMLAMTVGMSAVSYAQFPFHLMIGSAAPVTLSEQQGYQLALEQAVVKHTSRTTSLLSLPQNEALEQQEQPDGSIMIKVIKQYNSCPVGDYLEQ